MDGRHKALFEPDAAHAMTQAYGSFVPVPVFRFPGRGRGSGSAYPSLIFCRHGRQKTSRPGVGWNGTVVEAPQAEQTAW
jgi:hypothetical protein